MVCGHIFKVLSIPSHKSWGAEIFIKTAHWGKKKKGRGGNFFLIFFIFLFIFFIFFYFFFIDKSHNLSKIVSVLLSASVERLDVPRMRDFYRMFTPMSYVMCHVSGVRCDVSGVRCHMFFLHLCLLPTCLVTWGVILNLAAVGTSATCQIS